jgi:hypothetical protein
LHEGFVLWAFQTHLILQVLEMKIIYGEFFVSIYLLLLYWKLLYSIHYILYLFLCWRKKFFFFLGGVFSNCLVNVIIWLSQFLNLLQDNWLLLAADYSQIELRLMAHFSKDSSLIQLLSTPHGDVFTMIAARWTGKPDDCVDSNERDQTKKLVYGILYGMGANTLAEQLRCSSDEAAEKIRNFKSSFPGVASWLREAIAYCRQKG